MRSKSEFINRGWASHSNTVFLRAFASLREQSRRRKEFQREGAKQSRSETGAIKFESLGASLSVSEPRAVATGSYAQLSIDYYFVSLLFDPVATARGSDTIRGDFHI